MRTATTSSCVLGSLLLLAISAQALRCRTEDVSRDTDYREAVRQCMSNVSNDWNRHGPGRRQDQRNQHNRGYSGYGGGGSAEDDDRYGRRGYGYGGYGGGYGSGGYGGSNYGGGRYGSSSYGGNGGSYGSSSYGNGGSYGSGGSYGNGGSYGSGGSYGNGGPYGNVGSYGSGSRGSSTYGGSSGSTSGRRGSHSRGGPTYQAVNAEGDDDGDADRQGGQRGGDRGSYGNGGVCDMNTASGTGDRDSRGESSAGSGSSSSSSSSSSGGGRKGGRGGSGSRGSRPRTRRAEPKELAVQATSTASLAGLRRRVSGGGESMLEKVDAVNDNSHPDRGSVVGVMTRQIRDPELKDFIQESIDECFDILLSGSVGGRCDFSKNLALCLEEKGQRHCEDWDDNMYYNKGNNQGNRGYSMQQRPPRQHSNSNRG